MPSRDLATSAVDRLTGAGRRYVDRYHRRDQIVRKYVFAMLSRVTSRVAVDSGDLRYYVSTRDLLGRELYMVGHFEMQLFADALSIIARETGRSLAGKLFVDIGANIGTTVIPAVKLFGAERAVAFEPEPTNLRLLRQNLIENEVDHLVTVVPVALSDTDGEGTLELASRNWGDHRIRLGVPHSDSLFGEEERQTTSVPLRRFEDVSADVGLNLADVGVVWMDVQGHEGHVLKGAPSLLASDVPVVTEYWPYGLRRAAGIDALHELIAEHYSWVVDVRASAQGAEIVRVPAKEIRSLESRFDDGFTDLLLLG